MNNPHRLILFTMLPCLLSTTTLASESTLICDFSSGIPSDFAVYDLDGNTPAKNPAGLGFTMDSGWLWIDDSACSTSWYSPAGTSNDWLVTSAVIVENNNYVLRWKAKASHATYSDGYSVYISTTGNAPEDFSSEAAVKVEAEDSGWNLHTLSLCDYAGQEIWVAFVNDSYNCAYLYLDDLFIGPKSSTQLKIVSPEISSLAVTELKVLLENISEEDCSDVVVTVEFEDGEVLSFEMPESLRTGESEEVCLGEISLSQLYIPRNFIATVTINGESDYSVAGAVAYVPHRMVVEECTGSWCGYCVRGTVALEELAEEYPDHFIGIAVHYGDVFEVEDYSTQLSSDFHITSYPNAVFNRQWAMDPSSLYTYVDNNIPVAPDAYVEVSANYDEGRIYLNAEVTAVSNVEYPIALAFVVIENNVAIPGVYQYNAYSGGGEGEMGGWENFEKYVWSEDVPFQHVARYISDYNGHSESLIPSMAKYDTSSFEYSFDMPESVLVPANIKVVALLLNQDDGSIVNAVEADCANLPEIDGVTSILNDSKVSSNIIYDLSGRVVGNASDLSKLPKGSYILNHKVIIK